MRNNNSNFKETRKLVMLAIFFSFIHDDFKEHWNSKETVNWTCDEARNNGKM